MKLTNLYLMGGLGALLLMLTACQTATTPKAMPTVAEETPPAGLSADEAAALRSLERVDDFPLYTMTVTHDYHSSGRLPPGDLDRQQAVDESWGTPGWGCSLFASFANPQEMLYGRNFDWEYSPALLLFTRPPGAYASVAMVDIAYLDFTDEQIAALDETPLEERLALLHAPFIPFDGMNDQGLVIGMATVPSGAVPYAADKPTIGSLGVIREMLDHAATVEEAVGIFKSYNIEFKGRPVLHYLIADTHQKAVLVEFSAGKVVVIDNKADWLAATNFLVSETGGNPAGRCSRYDLITKRLSGGETLSTQDAFALLESVAQYSTQWSIVYDCSHGSVQVVMGQEFDKVYKFNLDNGNNND